MSQAGGLQGRRGWWGVQDKSWDTWLLAWSCENIWIFMGAAAKA